MGTVVTRHPDGRRSQISGPAALLFVAMGEPAAEAALDDPTQREAFAVLRAHDLVIAAR
jgi:hypothetical protein